MLKTYSDHLNEGDRLILKVPQIITAQKMPRGDQHVENEAYLNPKIFTNQFYEPAVKLLSSNPPDLFLSRDIKEDRNPLNEMAQALDKFFQMIPKDNRYHLELRTDLYLRPQVLDVLEKHGVGQVLFHWTWLPH